MYYFFYAKMKTWHIRYVFALMGMLMPVIAGAATDGTYTISVDSVGFAGGQASANGAYSVLDTVGDPITGLSADGAYQTRGGVWYNETRADGITLALSPANVDLGTLVAGTPNAVNLTAVITTNAPHGYTLMLSQDHDLTHATASGVTIPAFSAGTIAAPAAWGTHTGFGFTLLSGTNIAAKWGTSPDNNYAAIPATAEAVHTKAGLSTAPDSTTIQYKIDVAQMQQTGTYTNTVTYMAVANL